MIFALVGCLLVAISIGQLAKHLPSAGGFYTYTARGLHPTVGFLVAWGYAFVEPLIAPALYKVFAGVVAGTLRDEFGWDFGIWWVVAALAAAVLVFLLGYFGIQISARVGTLLGLFEIGVFAVLAVWLIVKAGDKNTLEVFGTKYATVEGFTGISGVIAGSVYTILAFIGFEAAAPLAEEAKDPRKTIGRAVVYSCIGSGVPHDGRRQSLGCVGPDGVGRGVGPGVPGHRQLGHRERERGFQRGNADPVRDGSDPFAPGHPGADPSAVSVTARVGVRSARDRSGRRPVAGLRRGQRRPADDDLELDLARAGAQHPRDEAQVRLVP